jgi:ABC-2 type transport system permease protein
VVTADDWRPMIAVELRKLVLSRRTWVTILLIDALPTLVGILLAVTDLGPRPGTGPAFLSAVLTDGTLFPLAALAIVLPLFLPIAVAVTAGEAIAGEAQQGTLRYLLVRPVGRTRLLVAKLVSVMVFVVLTVLVVAATAYVVGVLLLGSEDATTGATGVSGSSLSTQELAGRTMLALAYAMLCMLGVAAIALFLSTVVTTPLAAALGTMGVLVTSTVLLTLDAADVLQPYLPTRYWLSFVDLFRDPILWRDVERGVLLQGVYVVVFLGAAWANFATKDITD